MRRSRTHGVSEPAWTAERGAERAPIQTSLDRRHVIAGAGALAVTTVGSFAGGRGANAAGAFAQELAFADDAEALDLALSVELLSVALFAGGLEAFDPAAFAAAGLPETARADIELMLDQDRAHATRLSAAIADLGGTPVEPSGAAPAGDDAASFIELAAALKETAVAAYAAVAQSLSNPAPRETALGILSVEARHAARLLGVLDAPAFPAAIDSSRGRREIESAIAALAAGQPPAASSPRERGTDEESDEPGEQSAAGDRPRREPRRVQDAPSDDSGEDPEAELDQAGGPPPVQEVPIQGTTGGPGPTEATPSAATETETETESETGSDADERRRGSDPERPAAEEAASGAADQERFAAVVADAAAQLGVDPATVQIVEAEKTDWPDSSLGCPRPDEFYAQVVTPGFRVIVSAAGSELEYHTDRRGETLVLCQYYGIRVIAGGSTPALTPLPPLSLGSSGLRGRGARGVPTSHPSAGFRLRDVKRDT